MGEIIGSIIGFPVKIMAGRFLGPIEYGKFALIMSITQFFIIPMVFGLSSGAQRYIPATEDHDRQKTIVGFISLFFLITTLISTIFFIATKPLSLKIFGISEAIFWWALLFSIATAAFYVFDAIVRSLKNFKLVYHGIVLNSFVTVTIFAVLLFWIDDKSFTSITLANVIAFASSILLYLGFLTHKAKFCLKIREIDAKKVTHYSVLGIAGAVTGFLIGNTDRIFLNQILSLYWVGVYSVYINAANVFVGRFFQLFLNVYFPNISGEPNKKKIFNKLGKLFKVSMLPIFFFSVFSIWFIIWLFGKEFPVRLDLILLFSLNNCLYVFYQLYMWLLNSQGVRGMNQTLKILYFNTALNLVLFYVLISWIGIIGAIMATVTINLIFSVYFYCQVRRFIKNGLFIEKVE
ncbi:oligosaccharide flippase family protein [bacterium]|nr:oligosaccharide flippase family protein [bacterium]MBU1634365.1 oligosaccharide flippase family protein [bacterium]